MKINLYLIAQVDNVSCVQKQTAASQSGVFGFSNFVAERISFVRCPFTPFGNKVLLSKVTLGHGLNLVYGTSATFDLCLIKPWKAIVQKFGKYI